MREVVIASAVRTAIGKFGGTLADTSALDLSAIVIKEALKRAGIDGCDVDEVLMGSVLQAGLGQNIARQGALKAGIPDSTPAMTINRVCGSGLQTVIDAAKNIMLGDAEIIVAGGVENMSQAPYLLQKARWGQRMGDGTLTDSMIHEGLWDAINDYHMGITAENIAEKYQITREEQDAFAASSQQKTEAAQKAGLFEAEIVPVMIPQRKAEDLVFAQDEFPRPGVVAEKLARLRPAFKKDGTVTAANASGINDGAAAVVIMSKAKADELGITPLVVIKSYGVAGVDPAYMGIGPVPAVTKALNKAGITIEEVDLIEANEAFAAQSIAVARDLNFDMTKVNVNGGAIALGHPIVASGTRILVTLLYAMQDRQAKTGLATLCVGGGMGVALIVERV